MAKQPPPTIDHIQKELNALKVKRTIEKTNKYDKEIQDLKNKLDYFEWGIK